MLAEWAAIAIENARLYERSERAASSSARSAAGGDDGDRPRARRRDRSRADPGADRRARAGADRRARAADPAARGRRLVVAACAGEVPPGVRGRRLAGAGDALTPRRPRRRARPARVPRAVAGHARRARRARRTATTSRFCRRSPPARRPPSRRRARSRSSACATRCTRPRRSAAAGRASCTTRRCRGSAACGCCSTRPPRSDEPEAPRSPRPSARIEEEIDGLRGLIRELRPAALDELGLAAAIEGLAERIADARADRRRPPTSGSPRSALRAGARDRALPDRAGGGHQRGPPRGRAARRDRGHRGRRRICTCASATTAAASIPARRATGFGLTGMRERVALLHGELEVASSAARHDDHRRAAPGWRD